MKTWNNYNKCRLTSFIPLSILLLSKRTTFLLCTGPTGLLTRWQNEHDLKRFHARSVKLLLLTMYTFVNCPALKTFWDAVSNIISAAINKKLG